MARSNARQEYYKYIELLAKVVIRSSIDESLIAYRDERNFLQHFAYISDPRIERCKKHNLLDILFLAISAVMSGSEGWEDIEEFGHIKLDWLRQYRPFEAGIPRYSALRG